MKINQETLFELKSVAQPVYAGNRVFYLENTVNQEKNSYESEIFSVDLETKERQIWGTQLKNSSGLKVSPDEKWLSFLSPQKESGKTQLMIMPLQGGAASVLVEEKDISRYFWTEDASAIYYQSSEKVEASVGNSDQQDSKECAEKDFPKIKATTKVDYQSDGAGFLPEKRTHIKKIIVATKEVETIFETDLAIQLEAVTEKENLIYAGETKPEDEWHYGSMFYVYDIQMKKHHSLEESLPTGTYSFAALEGSKLLLLGNDLTYGFVTQDDLYLMDLETNSVVNLSKEQDLAIGNTIIGDFQQKNRGVAVTWLNETEIVVPVTAEGKLQLYLVNTKGEWQLVVDQLIDITDATKINEEQWAITYSTTTVPSRLAVLNLANGQLETLIDPNEALLEKLTVSQPERFWYKGADEWQIQGWYIPPVEVKQGHPAILYIHGGPQVCYGETFFHEMQVHAANGYGVIMLNPRGGQGYGQDFVRSILGDYGNKDYQDLLLGVDAVIANHPEINPAKIHVVGGSYGGFMTNWIVGHTDRFCSAVTQRSISNWISFYGTSDIGSTFVKYQLLHDIDETEPLWAMSPLKYAEQVKTPTLVLHGENDLRCPQEQGQQFYTALKRQKIDTKLILFPQSSHGLSRSGLPNLRLERLTAITDWMKVHE
jgi:dipeptidyl aminopeptidase/acylaminoacyl peptidase